MSQVPFSSRRYANGKQATNPVTPICPCDGTGIRAGIRVQILQVQILSGVLSSRGGTEDALDRESSFLQVQILSRVPKYLGVAQLGAREFWELQVVGSIPTTQTSPL